MKTLQSPPVRMFRPSLGIALAGLGFMTLVWEPLAAKREAARTALARGQPSLRLPAASDPAAAISAAAARARLTIRSIGTQGAGTRVVIDDAEFGRTLDWLARLDRDGLQVSAISLDRRAQPGRVSVDVTLRSSR